MIVSDIFCDRCGRKIATLGSGQLCLVNQIRVLDYDKSDDFIRYDICKSCMRAFHNLMAKKVLDYSDITKED